MKLSMALEATASLLMDLVPKNQKLLSPSQGAAKRPQSFLSLPSTSSFFSRSGRVAVEAHRHRRVLAAEFEDDRSEISAAARATTLPLDRQLAYLGLLDDAAPLSCDRAAHRRKDRHDSR
jgi:hypothetical protein